MNKTLLPWMRTNTSTEVIGAIKFGIREKKMTALFGEPGSGKTSILRNYKALKPDSHLILCSPFMSTKDLLLAIASELNIHVFGSSYIMQDQIINCLQDVSDCCFLFDECEYLSGGRGSKIDVIRQIYDQTENVTMVLSGTYRLKELLSGTNSNNQPQIFRRLIKAEFGIVKSEEVLNYLSLLETEFFVKFSADVRRELCSLPNDQNNGGLGVFFAILECILSLVRPEWREICYQNRNNEKWDRPECADVPKEKMDPVDGNNQVEILIDVSKLTTMSVDKQILKTALRMQMSK